MNINLLPHIGDILAIPFFGLLVYYFFHLNNRTFLEDILLLFSFIGFFADILFTYMFFTKRTNI